MMMRNVAFSLDRLRRALLAIVFLALPFQFVPAVQAQVPETIAYQGYLTDAAGTPLDGTADLTFRLYERATGGSALWEEAQSGVAVSGGVFAVQLGSVEPVADVAFDRPLWLALRVDGGEELAPRVPLTAVPYSLRAARVDAAALKAGTNVTITPDTDGALVIEAEGGSGGNAWQLGGNASTDPATDFLGTTDETSLEARVNGERALRIEPVSTEQGMSPNLIGGYRGNSVEAGVFGATIGGGGVGTDPNTVTGSEGTISGGSSNTAGPRASVGGGRGNNASGDFATVGGGNGNAATALTATVGGGGSNTSSGEGTTIGGGKNNTASVDHGTVGGGVSNTASGGLTTVGGGVSNTASGNVATVGGGWGNTASSFRATVGGGEDNTASGGLAAVPGGKGNHARGQASFAAGNYARAAHDGTFVWSDNSQGIADSLVSTAEYQFLIRATGGVGIGTNAPSSPLTVAGIVESTEGGFKLPDGTILDSASDLGDGGSNTLPEPLFIDGENVGIGTKSPSSPLTVVGVVESTEGGFMLPDGTVLDDQSDLGGDGALAEAISVDERGKVGIGTSAPARRLSVRDANHQLELVDSANEKNWTVTTIGDQGVGFYEDGSTSRMMIEAGGKVGIGTNSPSDRLQVDASAGEDALRVRVDGTTRLRVHDNGGVSVGVNAGPPPGGLLVEGDIEYNEPQTRWFSLSAGDFAYPRGGGPNFPDAISCNQATECNFGAGIHLPHGSQIIEMQASVSDQGVAGDVEMMLYRQPHGQTAGFKERMAQVSTAGVPGSTVILDSSVNQRIVDNENYAYYVVTVIPPGFEYNLFAVRITYTTTSPLP